MGVFREHNMQVKTKPDSLLTNREAEVIYWLANGKTYEVIGTILDISPRTVRAHIENAIDKYDAINTVNLINICCSLDVFLTGDGLTYEENLKNNH